MKFWKKSFTLRIPVWCLILICILTIVGVVLCILSQTNFWLNLQLRTMDTQDVASITLYMGEHSVVLDKTDTKQMVKLINTIELEGKPFIPEGWIGSGSLYTYKVTLKNGDVLYMDDKSLPDAYLYHINDKLYYAGNKEKVSCTALDQWLEIYQSHCIKYFSTDPYKNPVNNTP